MCAWNAGVRKHEPLWKKRCCQQFNRWLRWAVCLMLTTMYVVTKTDEKRVDSNTIVTSGPETTLWQCTLWRGQNELTSISAGLVRKSRGFSTKPTLSRVADMMTSFSGDRFFCWGKTETVEQISVEVSYKMLRVYTAHYRVTKTKQKRQEKYANLFFSVFFWDQALRVIITVLQDNSFSWLWLDPHVNDSVGVCEALHSSSNPFLQIKTKSALQEPLEMRHEGKRRRKTKKRKNKERERQQLTKAPQDLSPPLLVSLPNFVPTFTR